MICLNLFAQLLWYTSRERCHTICGWGWLTRRRSSNNRLDISCLANFSWRLPTGRRRGSQLAKAPSWSRESPAYRGMPPNYWRPQLVEDPRWSNSRPPAGRRPQLVEVEALSWYRPPSGPDTQLVDATSWSRHPVSRRSQLVQIDDASWSRAPPFFFFFFLLIVWFKCSGK